MTAVQGRTTDPLAAVAWPVRTVRLLLRRAQPHDAEATWQFRRLPQFTQWMTRAPGTFEQYVAQFAEQSSLSNTLVIELHGSVIGDLWVSVQDAWAQEEVAEHARGVQADLGCGLHPAHSGRGYATEGIREVLRLCFGELGLRRVTAECFADNTASWRLMERVGMRREAYTVRDSLDRKSVV